MQKKLPYEKNSVNVVFGVLVGWLVGLFLGVFGVFSVVPGVLVGVLGVFFDVHGFVCCSWYMGWRTWCLCHWDIIVLVTFRMSLCI